MNRRTYAITQIMSIIVCIFFVCSALPTMGTQGQNTNIKPEDNITLPNILPVNILKHTLFFSQPTLNQQTILNEKYTSISQANTLSTGTSTGAPTLPVSTLTLVLPPFTTVQDIQLYGSPTPVQSTINLKQAPIIPYQPSTPIGENPPQEIRKNMEIYTRNQLFPSTPLNEYSVATCRGYTLCSLSLNPVQYNPIEGTLLYYQEITVEFELQESHSMHTLYRHNPSDKLWVETLVDNPDLLDQYSQDIMFTGYDGGLCNPVDDYDYVIITTEYNNLDHWVTDGSTPYNWSSLMHKHHIDNNLDCTLVTIEEIDTCQDYWNDDPLFDDLPARIREFCRDAYLDWGIEYVLIGGDDEWIPAREMDYYYEGDVESDLYWSNLDNTFNDDYDDDWGEEGDTGFDPYSELFIGRLTCDEPRDVSNWMKKSLYYADSIDNDYLNNAAFYGGDTGWLCEGDDYIDYTAIKGVDNWLGPDPNESGPYPDWLGFGYGFETWNQYNPGMAFNLSVKWTGEPPNPGWHGGFSSLGKEGLKEAINDNHVTLISGIAHANAGMSLDVGSSTWESQYHNTKPFFIHDFGCHCGDMGASDDGVLHSMLFHSDTELAFACVYNTCYGWGNFYNTNSSSSMQQKLFWDYYFNIYNYSHGTNNWELGKAMAFSKDMMAATLNWGDWGTWRGIIQGCLLFGDPAQSLKPPNQHQHNLGVKNLDFSDHQPLNTLIDLQATLYNNGLYDETNITVELLIDQMVLDAKTIPYFPKNSLQEISFEYETPSTGWETITVSITPIPQEDYEQDNKKEQVVIYGADTAITSLNVPYYVEQGCPLQVDGDVANLGYTHGVVTVQLRINHLIYDSQDIYLESGQQTHVMFMYDTTNIDSGIYDITLHAVPIADEVYLFNQNRTTTIDLYDSKGRVLLVDDDLGENLESYYIEAILSSHYSYDYWDYELLGPPSSDTMIRYHAVIWYTGTDSRTSLIEEDRQVLSTYLDWGGALFVSGSAIAYDLRDDPFLNEYLYADRIGWTPTRTIEGEANDFIGENLSFSIAEGDGANNQHYTDRIEPLSPAEPCFWYTPDPYDPCGIHVEDDTYRLVYLSFGFEAIDTASARNMLMNRILTWLPVEHDLTLVDFHLEDPIIQGEGTTVSATIINNGFYDEYNVRVDFYAGSEYNDTLLLDTLEAGENREVSFDWDPEIGHYSVTIFVFPVDDEDRLSNNYQTEPTTVIQAFQDDITVLDIITPKETIHASNQTIQATIRNVGDLDQNNIPLTSTIYSVEPHIFLSESFEASFPPTGWTQEEDTEWMQMNTNDAGGEPPEAALEKMNINNSYSYLQTLLMNTSTALDLTLTFSTSIEQRLGSIECSILIRPSCNQDWIDATPWENPLKQGVSKQEYTISIDQAIGPETQIRFESHGSRIFLERWALDDIQVTTTRNVNITDIKYTSSTSVDIPAHTSTDIVFPQHWQATPEDYYVTVTADLLTDENPSNDCLGRYIFVDAQLAGDINYDGLVNLQDLGILLAAWGTIPDDPGWNPAADLNDDGIIDLEDLGILLADFNQ